jgi:hypothetical protein
MKDTTVARYSVSQLKARNGFDADESVVLGVDHDRRVEQLASALRDARTGLCDMIAKIGELLSGTQADQSICDNCGKPLRDHVKPLMTCFPMRDGGTEHG